MTDKQRLYEIWRQVKEYYDGRCEGDAPEFTTGDVFFLLTQIDILRLKLGLHALRPIAPRQKK